MSDAKINDGGPAFPQHEKLKVLAELDGWTQIKDEVLGSGGPGRIPSPHGVPPGKNYRAICKSYLTSYDAIIPLIQRQPMGIRVTLEKNCTVFDSAEQLCDALLRATGKWKE